MFALRLNDSVFIMKISSDKYLNLIKVVQTIFLSVLSMLLIII